MTTSALIIPTHIHTRHVKREKRHWLHRMHITPQRRHCSKYTRQAPEQSLGTYLLDLSVVIQHAHPTQFILACNGLHSPAYPAFARSTSMLVWRMFEYNTPCVDYIRYSTLTYQNPNKCLLDSRQGGAICHILSKKQQKQHNHASAVPA